MSTNRFPKEYARRPSFDAATLELFVRLENMRAKKDTDEYRNLSKDLARRLNLMTQWWACCRVEDTGPKPVGPMTAAQFYWSEVRAVRNDLLRAIGGDPPLAA